MTLHKAEMSGQHKDRLYMHRNHFPDKWRGHLTNFWLANGKGTIQDFWNDEKIKVIQVIRSKG